MKAQLRQRTPQLAATSYPAADQGQIIVWGLLGRAPYGGMTWQVTQYLWALRRLGFDVWYVEDSDAFPLHPETRERTATVDANVQFVNDQLARIGLQDRWAVRVPRENRVVGALDYRGLCRLYQDADAVINLCGAQELLSHHSSARCLIYLETDPVVNQIAVASGDTARIQELDAYQYHFTYGANLGSAECSVPVVRYDWKKTRPPVVAEWWTTDVSPKNKALTTVANWKHSNKDVRWKGELWRWSKHEQFLRFVDLPTQSRLPLEAALVGAGDKKKTLEQFGWRCRSAWALADPELYRTYIRESLGEFSVAKDQYVLPRTGWFSDRTVCYLAASRPVIIQDTGIGDSLPVGEGLLLFSGPADAIQAIDVLATDYERHARAAYEIAQEYFAAERVLQDLLSSVGLL